MTSVIYDSVVSGALDFVPSFSGGRVDYVTLVRSPPVRGGLSFVLVFS